MNSVIPVCTDDRTLYQPPADPVLIRVPPFQFVMIDGTGDPGTSPGYQAAVAALYAVSYPVVITLKRAGRPELKVRPLEGLWWADNLSVFDPSYEDRQAWHWTMMIRQPDDVPGEVYDAAFGKMARKTGTAVADRVRLERFDEGLCAQIMHHGPYAYEGPSIVRLHDFAAARGLRLRGHHHEIYLSDPRKSAPEKLRTVLRHPVMALSLPGDDMATIHGEIVIGRACRARADPGVTGEPRVRSEYFMGTLGTYSHRPWMVA